MADHSYLLFNKTPEDMRRIGARGGRASGRNRRARLLLLETAVPAAELDSDGESAAEAIGARRARREANLTMMPAVPEIALPAETAAQAMAALDAQFPWLIGAGKCNR
jgi:hypothetical protein